MHVATMQLHRKPPLHVIEDGNGKKRRVRESEAIQIAWELSRNLRPKFREIVCPGVSAAHRKYQEEIQGATV